MLDWEEVTGTLTFSGKAGKSLKEHSTSSPMLGAVKEALAKEFGVAAKYVTVKAGSAAGSVDFVIDAPADELDADVAKAMIDDEGKFAADLADALAQTQGATEVYEGDTTAISEDVEASGLSAHGVPAPAPVFLCSPHLTESCGTR